jgi:hypothetical protein
LGLAGEDQRISERFWGYNGIEVIPTVIGFMKKYPNEGSFIPDIISNVALRIRMNTLCRQIKVTALYHSVVFFFKHQLPARR